MNGLLFIEFLKNAVLMLLRIEPAGKFPRPLSKKEEAQALIDMKNGSRKARDELIEHNLRLVMHIVKKYYTDDKNRDDLVSIGTLGLIKGVDSFKPEKGARLATYASRCIENELLMHFRSVKKTQQDVSMSDPIETDSDGNELTLADIIAAEDTIADSLDTRAKCKRLRELVKDIADDRDRLVVTLRYGIDGGEPLTQQQTAKRLGISRSYVSRIESRVLKQLRYALEHEICI